jgi:hypothetical protein
MAWFGSLAPQPIDDNPDANGSASLSPSLLDLIKQRISGQPVRGQGPITPLAEVPQSLRTTMPPEPVQEVMKSTVEPLTNAGWMLGGAMQGTEKPSAVDVMKAGGGLALGLMPVGPGEAGAAARGVEAATEAGAKALAHPARIAQRLPTNVGAIDQPLNHIGIDAMKESPKLYEHNVGLVKDYPNMRPEDTAGTTDETATNFKEHVKDNLRWLYDQVPQDIRDRSQLWYDGANAIVRGRAQSYGLPDQSVAGVYAAMSPQKDWFQNVDLGDRVLHIYHNQAPWSPEMDSTFQRIFPSKGSERSQTNWNRLYDLAKDKSLADIKDPDVKALWVRLYDQSHHVPDYNIVTPEGAVSHPAVNQNGQPSKVAWGSLVEIEKAIRSIESGGDPALLSKAMGEKHKVRNFYNNMLDPNNPHGDVTIDTHAVAAGLLRPLSGNSVEVGHNLGLGTGEKSSAVSGVSGNYGLYADAYRELAKELGIQPRQLQSITWEAGKGLFKDTFKSNAKNVEAINGIWQKYRDGVISADEARNQIHERAGGIEPPEWYRR